MPLTEDAIENVTTYHEPTNEAAIRHTALREAVRAFLAAIEANCPDSREKSVAVTNAETAMFWANASIARNHDKLRDI